MSKRIDLLDRCYKYASNGMYQEIDKVVDSLESNVDPFILSVVQIFHKRACTNKVNLMNLEIKHIDSNVPIFVSKYLDVAKSSYIGLCPQLKLDIIEATKRDINRFFNLGIEDILIGKYIAQSYFDLYELNNKKDVDFIFQETKNYDDARIDISNILCDSIKILKKIPDQANALYEKFLKRTKENKFLINSKNKKHFSNMYLSIFSF